MTPSARTWHSRSGRYSVEPRALEESSKHVAERVMPSDITDPLPKRPVTRPLLYCLAVVAAITLVVFTSSMVISAHRLEESRRKAHVEPAVADSNPRSTNNETRTPANASHVDPLRRTTREAVTDTSRIDDKAMIRHHGHRRSPRSRIFTFAIDSLLQSVNVTKVTDGYNLADKTKFVGGIPIKMSIAVDIYNNVTFMSIMYGCDFTVEPTNKTADLKNSPLTGTIKGSLLSHDNTVLQRWTARLDDMESCRYPNGGDPNVQHLFFSVDGLRDMKAIHDGKIRFKLYYYS